MSPFSGMDPYLEAPDIWPDFHERLAAVTVDYSGPPEPPLSAEDAVWVDAQVRAAGLRDPV